MKILRKSKKSSAVRKKSLKSNFLLVEDFWQLPVEIVKYIYIALKSIRESPFAKDTTQQSLILIFQKMEVFYKVIVHLMSCCTGM